MVDNNNLYKARLEFTTANAVVLSLRKRVAGAETELDTYTAPLTHVATTFYRVRFQVTGSTLRAKVWATTVPEPEAWQVSASDTELTSADSVGTRSLSNAGNTNVNPALRYDNFALVNPQTFTVTQAAVNGVAKTVPAGSAVELATKAYVGMW
jgi:hypothetical protein